MDKRERILSEAEKLFSKKGYYGLSLSELFERCEIPKGSFYYFFPGGKEQLIKDTLRFSYERMVHGITNYILIKPTALASFENMADHLACGVCEHKNYASLFMTMVAIESVYMDESINATCRELYGSWQRLYADFLMKFGFEKDAATVKAQAIFAMIHGSLVSSWVKRDPHDLLLVKENLKDIIGDK